MCYKIEEVVTSSKPNKNKGPNHKDPNNAPNQFSLTPKPNSIWSTIPVEDASEMHYQMEEMGRCKT